MDERSTQEMVNIDDDTLYIFILEDICTRYFMKAMIDRGYHKVLYTENIMFITKSSNIRTMDIALICKLTEVNKVRFVYPCDKNMDREICKTLNISVINHLYDICKIMKKEVYVDYIFETYDSQCLGSNNNEKRLRNIYREIRNELNDARHSLTDKLLDFSIMRIAENTTYENLINMIDELKVRVEQS